MFKTNFVLTLAITALSSVFASTASAGCGKDLANRLSVLLPEAQGLQVQARTQTIPMRSREGLAAESARASSNVTGLWSSSVSLQGIVIFQAFESFTSDGLEFLNDSGSPLEGNVCLGTWTSITNNSINVYHPSWSYDSKGNLIGTVVIKSELTFDEGGRTFKGTVTVDSYDLNGKVSAPRLQADVTGKRITP